ncbi:MAG: radical SAM/SPASM domain-containing protein [Planctomycetota bacterium]|jgi:radical SAM protein with 4Fe4S-binding SPASM domain
MIGINGKLINPEIRIENTNRCNAMCVVCSREKMTRIKTEMDWGVFCGLVMQGVELGVDTISVFGYGEPLLDKTLEEKIGYCSDQGLKTWLTTNGSLLGLQRSYDLISAGLKDIRFSFHAITPLQYERVHRGLDWIKTVRNIANFIHVNNKAGHPVNVHLTCIPLDGEPTEHIVETWQKHVDYLEIWKPHNWVTKRWYRKPNPVLRTCGRPFSGPVQIQADGNVIPCCFLTDNEIVLGNIHDNTIFDILTGSKYEELRYMHRVQNYKNIACEICDQRNIEDENPLIYSSRDPYRQINKTSTVKKKLTGDRNDLYSKKDKYDSDSGGTCDIGSSFSCA